MSKDAFDYWPNNPVNKTEEYECPMCGTRVDYEGQYCSASCARADDM